MQQIRPNSIPDKFVVLTFDDGCKSQATYIAPLLIKYGFGATFYITEGLNFLTNKNTYMTWEDIRGLHNTGFEIGKHTRHHKNVTQQSEQDLRDDLHHIDLRCEEYGISKPTTLCNPGYSNNDTAVEVIANHCFRYARRGVYPEYEYDSEGGRGPAYDPSAHHPFLVPTTGASGPNWDFDDFIWDPEQAEDGKIAVLTFHGVPDLEHPWVHTEPDDFEKYMQYLTERNYTVIALRDRSGQSKLNL